MNNFPHRWLALLRPLGFSVLILNGLVARTAEPWRELLTRAERLERERTSLPSWTEPGAAYFVAPDGSDNNAGTRDRPFATLERARDAVRVLKRGEGLPSGGVSVWIAGGQYPMPATFALGREDSGRVDSPIRYRALAGDTPVFSGAVRLREFEPVRDAAVTARLPETARDRVVEADLGRHGITEVWPLVLGGFASGRGFRTHPMMELYFDGVALPLARGPEDGWIEIEAVSTQQVVQAHGRSGSKMGRFTYPGDYPARWQNEAELWLYGYWFWDWADSYERVARIDPERREIALEPPFHSYGYRAGQRFYAVNALAELDRPGEWYLDRERRRIYLWPPGDPTRAVVTLSTANFVFLELDEVSDVAFEGITWEGGCRDAVQVRGGQRVWFAGCTLRQFGGNGLELGGGAGHGVLSCDVHTLGRGGIVMSGGDRRTLAPGGHVIENCHVHHLSRIDHTYTPAVLCSGVGHRIAHNRFHDIGSSALRLGGNEHLVEFNEIFRVVLESDDQGAVDMWGDATYRGNVYRHNYFHHVGSRWVSGKEPRLGQAGIRLDDAISGTLIQGNVFFRVGGGGHGFGGVQIHGGKENLIDRNLFVECAAAVSFSPWGDRRWREFVATALNSTQIDGDLYVARYPELARLAEDHDVNWIRGNLAVGCAKWFNHGPGAAVDVDNRAVDEHAAFRVTGDGNLECPTDPAQWHAAGLDPIPLARIGLYRDSYRQRLPEDARGSDAP